ncbi:MAG: M14 family zinc carboxypeptidase, partial [Gemmatimonadota bacterium]
MPRFPQFLLLLILALPQAATTQEEPFIAFDHYHTLAGEGALAFLERILSGYGTDPEITELVDGRAFYVVPIVNPDGRAISLDTPENQRWNIRPFDEDSDGRVDEDPPEDLDGDDWASKVFGVLAMTTEMWAHAPGESQDALFRWNDSVEVQRNVDWVLTFAKKTPQVAVLEATANRVDRGDAIRVEARVANVGWTATATVHATESLGTAKPVRVHLELDNATLVEGEASVDLGVLPGTHGE